MPERFVLAVGTSHERKNLPRLIAAVAALRGAGEPDLALVLAGPGDAGHAESWVRHLGYVSDEVLRALYSRAAAVAYVSLYEGFGLPVLEALACGATVVASSTTAVGEAAGDACILVEPSDVDAIGAGLRAALGDAALRDELHGRAAAHLARFTWTDAAAKMAEIYRAIARR